VAYKKDVDDPRESPAFEIMELLRQGGAHVAYNDPYIPVLPAMRHHASPSREPAACARDARAQDCVVIVTDHSVYKCEWIARHAQAIVDPGTPPRASGRLCRIWKA